MALAIGDHLIEMPVAALHPSVQSRSLRPFGQDRERRAGTEWDPAAARRKSAPIAMVAGSLLLEPGFCCHTTLVSSR